MSRINEIIVDAVIPAIKEIGKAELVTVLSGIKANHTAETYQKTLNGLHSNFLLLRETAYKTKTRIDDGIIDLVLNAVKESAAAGGIVLL
jgi:short-subunit dehydrogenase involved in D-alanine esterification of teichoic acids